jgi:hypothetical protein
MTTLQLANELQALAVLSLAAIVWLKLLPMQRLDKLRQQLFSLRDEMFDYAADGNIGFDDPAYVLLRNQMNGFIRFGHQITLFRLVMSACGRRAAGKPLHATWTNQWSLSISGVSNESVRRDMVRFHERASSIVAKHLIKGSIILSMMVAFAVVAGIASGGIVSVKQALNKASGKVLSGPIDPRVIEEQAFCAA